MFADVRVDAMVGSALSFLLRTATGMSHSPVPAGVMHRRERGMDIRLCS